MKDGNATVKGMGFLDVLQIVFIVLKLCKFITWKWVFVLLPLELQILFFVVCIVIIILCSKKRLRGIK